MIRAPLRLRILALVLLGIGTTGCEIISPSENEIVGSYEGVTLTSASGTIALGSDTGDAARMLLLLNEDGTTAGYAYLPNGAGSGEAIDTDLAGVWYIGLEGVLLDLATPSILEELFFNRRGELLIGAGGSPLVIVELRRQD